MAIPKLTPMLAMAPRFPAAKAKGTEIIAMIKAPDYSALTIAQSKYPGWKAEKENGQPLNAAELVTEKGRFQSYALPSGNYQARIFYRDDKFIIGAGISLLSLTACCALLWLAKLRS